MQPSLLNASNGSINRNDFSGRQFDHLRIKSLKICTFRLSQYVLLKSRNPRNNHRMAIFRYKAVYESMLVIETCWTQSKIPRTGVSKKRL